MQVGRERIHQVQFSDFGERSTSFSILQFQTFLILATLGQNFFSFHGLENSHSTFQYKDALMIPIRGFLFLQQISWSKVAKRMYVKSNCRNEMKQKWTAFAKIKDVFLETFRTLYYYHNFVFWLVNFHFCLFLETGHFNIFVGDLAPEVTDATLYACFSVFPSCS